MFWSPNQFRSRCYRCGGTVEPGEGSRRYVQPKEVGRKDVGTLNPDILLVEHHECREHYDGTDFWFPKKPGLRPEPVDE